MGGDGRRCNDMPVEIELFRRQTECEADQLRQMQDRNIKLLAQVARDLTLESIEHRVAERAGGHHRLRAPCFGGQDGLAWELDRDFFIMRSGVEAAAFRSPAVIDGPAAQNFSE